jgi:hypothetical protein
MSALAGMSAIEDPPPESCQSAFGPKATSEDLLVNGHF